MAFSHANPQSDTWNAAKSALVTRLSSLRRVWCRQIARYCALRAHEHGDAQWCVWREFKPHMHRTFPSWRRRLQRGGLAGLYCLYSLRNDSSAWLSAPARHGSSSRRSDGRSVWAYEVHSDAQWTTALPRPARELKSIIRWMLHTSTPRSGRIPGTRSHCIIGRVVGPMAL
jgi:hypothetical protein